ncbi:MAG: polysaccharide pyruvyl transferase CsaB [Candidatus Bipolaricaulota bacterium]|nr:polysaccharide pyruvyl transferase CsaB [Candidatus Bipolaricaulota bacterium]
MATTLVIAGYYGFGNWGDEASLAVLTKYLRGALPHARLVVLSNDPEQTAQLHGTEAITRWNLCKIRRALARASGFLLGPGSLLQDATSTRSLLYYLGLVRLAQHYNLPTYLIGQGIGPLRSRRSERWVAKTLQQARLVLVRDRASYQWAEAHDARVLLGEDLAVLSDLTPYISRSLSVYGEGQGEVREGQGERPKGTRRVGLSLRPGLSPHNIEVLRRALRTLSTDFELLFLPFQADQDQAVLRELALTIPAVEAHDPADLLRAVQSVDIVLGMRLHSLVFALLCDVPFCALSYDPKIEGFLHRLEEVCEYPVPWWSASDSLDESALVQRILELATKGAELRERLRHARALLQAAARHSLEEAIRVIARELTSP